MEKTFAVATKAVVINPNGQYLVLKKSNKEDVNPNTYDLPGGRLNFGEKPEEGVVREVKEETGLDVEIVKVFNTWTFTKNDNFQLVGIDFICKTSSEEVKISDEHDESIWVNIDQIETNNQFPSWLVKTLKKAHISL